MKFFLCNQCKEQGTCCTPAKFQVKYVPMPLFRYKGNLASTLSTWLIFFKSLLAFALQQSDLTVIYASITSRSIL